MIFGEERRELAGMVVVITGASAGIGRALAQALSVRGARLVLAARRLHRLVALNESLGGRHVCVQTDVSDPAQCEALIARAVEAYGRIDTLVCNAGFGLIRPVADLRREELRTLFETNLFGTIDCVRHAVPHMKCQAPRNGVRGQIVIVTSAAARRGLPGFGAYTASKAAQLSVAEAHRVELREQAIAVTSVHPCGTDTEFFRAAIRTSGALPPRRNAIELHQSAAEVAAVIARAMERPVPEAWTLRRFRWLLNLAAFFPAITDRVMARRHRADAAPLRKRFTPTPPLPAEGEPLPE